MQIDARLLDGAVWSLAVDAIRDPSIFERLVANDDGPAVRVDSLRAQLTNADTERERLQRRLARLEGDDELVDEYEEMLRKNKAQRVTLAQALEAAQKKLDDDTAQRATLAAFREYAASQSDTLNQKTPLERRRILLAMRARCTVASGEGLGRVFVRFDLRGLPGAAQAFDYPGWDEPEPRPEDLVPWTGDGGEDIDFSTIPVIPSFEILGLDDDAPPVTTLPAGSGDPDPSQLGGVLAASLCARTPGGPASHAR